MVALVSKALAAFAVLFVSTASFWYFHRPKTPRELKKN
jgi:cyclic lactone autoinducer peptide